MKPQIFVGSSSESIDYAYAVQKNLEPVSDVTVWDQGIFNLNNATLDDLISSLGKMDFAVFIFSPHDKLNMRDKESQVVRDNVIFEFGLFVGRLGKERSFFIIPKDAQDLHLPTDLLGIKPAKYDAGRKELQAALGSACFEIKQIIKSKGIRNESRLNIIKFQKDVYTYLFNRLNPYQDILLTHDFLKSLPTTKRFLTIDDVLLPLVALIRHYVPQFISPEMRVYFAYRLEDPVQVSPDKHPGRTAPFKAYYRIGLAFSKVSDNWIEGVPLGIPSNVHRAYIRKNISEVPDATRTLNLSNEQNHVVTDEASVIALPIVYSDEENPNECIGVIGLSSPEKEEVTQPEFQALARELSTLFSALFYAYGKYLQRTKTFAEVIKQIRTEIDDHFESKFQ